MKLDISIGTDEAFQIVVSVLAISLAFAIVFAGIDGMLKYPKEFVLFLLPLLVTVGSGFILHEMAHKLVAIYYGANARFVMWLQGLIFMLVTSIFGVLFAAPGAVYIYADRITKKENGLISIAGPMVNVIIAVVFVALHFTFPINYYFSFLAGETGIHGFGISNGILQVWRFGAAINIMLALFNMIPAFPLDGSKVFGWSRLVWISSIVILLALGTVIISPGVVISWAIMLLVVGLISKLLFSRKN